MLYKAKKLRALDARLEDGIEGFYRYSRQKGYSRKWVAGALGISVYSLAHWVTRWNRAKKENASERA